jgi:TetR/AcrR family transcriptional repressor of nem operon
MSEIVNRACQLLERQRTCLERVDSLDGLERWRDAVVRDGSPQRGHGEPVPGPRAHELGDTPADGQSAARSAGQWEDLLAATLERMRAAGVLRGDADPAALAIGIVAALQGGYLLASIARDIAPMKIALDMAIDRVKTCARQS